MSSDFKINRSPEIEGIELPSGDITTYDGHEVTLGTVCYFRFTPGRVASEYRLVSGRALRRRDGGHDIIVVGPRCVVGAMNVKDFVVDPNQWWEFRERHYGATPATSRR